jgi:UDP-N-acetylmuramyl-tripeptide synthetase
VSEASYFSSLVAARVIASPAAVLPCPMLLSTLIPHLGEVDVRGPTDRQIARVTHDSRDAGPSDLFVAIRGQRVDARDFVPGLNIAAVIADGEVRCQDGVTVLQVPDARRALAYAAAALAGHPGARLPTVGLTGTNGKTTVSWFLESILQAGGETAGIIGTTGHRIGERGLPAKHTTPEAPRIQALLSQMLQADCRAAIMEVSSIALAMYRADGIPFKVAVFTNLSRDHLDFHGDMADYLAAKARLFTELLADDGIAVLFADDPASSRIDTQDHTRWTYGFSPGADFHIAAMRQTLAGSEVELHTPDGVVNLGVQLLGAHNGINAVAAVAAGRALGFDLQTCASGIAELARVPGRLEAVPNDKQITVLVDYAHTPDALQTVLHSLASLGAGRVLTVMGCGGDRDPGKRPEMGAAAAAGSDKVFVTSDNPRSEDPQAIIAAIVSGITGPHAVLPDRAEAIRAAVFEAGPGDIVLIAGKGHEQTQTTGTQVVHFDDVAVAQAAIGDRP